MSLGSQGIIGNESFSEFMDFDYVEGGLNTNIPFLWNASGEPLGRWPTNYASIPGSNGVIGVFKPSSDFKHLAFSSNNVDFDPRQAGLTTAPGSAYDNNTVTKEITVVSKTPGGANIPARSLGNTSPPKKPFNFLGCHLTDPISLCPRRVQMAGCTSICG